MLQPVARETWGKLGAKNGDARGKLAETKRARRSALPPVPDHRLFTWLESNRINLTRVYMARSPLFTTVGNNNGKNDFTRRIFLHLDVKNT